MSVVLADHIAALSAPCRAADCLIGAAVKLTAYEPDGPTAEQALELWGLERFAERAESHQNIWSSALPRYTASIDAAMTLVPEGWFWMAGNRDRITPRAYVENGKLAYVGVGTSRNPARLWSEVTAATPALALTAAALRARAMIAKAVEEGGDGRTPASTL